MKEQIKNQIEKLKSSDLKTGFMGLKIKYENTSKFFKTLDELQGAVKMIDTTNLYSLNVEVSEHQFLSVTVVVSYLTENEIGKPLNLVKISRNIRALKRSNYQYSDDHSVWKFWNNLRTKLDAKIASLHSDEKELLTQLTA